MTILGASGYSLGRPCPPKLRQVRHKYIPEVHMAILQNKSTVFAQYGLINEVIFYFVPMTGSCILCVCLLTRLDSDS